MPDPNILASMARTVRGWWKQEAFWMGVTQNVVAGLIIVAISLAYAVVIGLARRPFVVYTVAGYTLVPAFFYVYFRFVVRPLLKVLNGKREVDEEERLEDHAIFGLVGAGIFMALMLGYLYAGDAILGSNIMGD